MEASEGNASKNTIQCLRCHCKTQFVGTQHFHEGTRIFDAMGGIFELLKNREHFDVYICPRCGHVEFFAEGIGDEVRDREQPLEESVSDEQGFSEEFREAWRCTTCGETVPSNFDVCWKCQSQRDPSGQTLA